MKFMVGARSASPAPVVDALMIMNEFLNDSIAGCIATGRGKIEGEIEAEAILCGVGEAGLAPTSKREERKTNNTKK